MTTLQRPWFAVFSMAAVAGLLLVAIEFFGLGTVMPVVQMAFYLTFFAFIVILRWPALWPRVHRNMRQAFKLDEQDHIWKV